MGDRDKGTELPNGVSGHLLLEAMTNVSGPVDPGKEIA
jgi:hypothetical protein